MKTERAIELLHRISDSQFDGIHGDERREALEMAIRALEGDGDMISRKAVMKEFADFVRKSNNSDFAQTPTWNDAVSLVGSMPSAQPETHDKRTETHACDLINRQQAIDAVKDLPNCRNGFSDTYDKACIIGVLEDLSTALPQWIPCSERLPEHPENDDYYLVTIQYEHYDGWDDYVTGFAEWTKHGWDELSCYIGQIKVIAWMPLPKPYGGESE